MVRGLAHLYKFKIDPALSFVPDPLAPLPVQPLPQARPQQLRLPPPRGRVLGQPRVRRQPQPRPQTVREQQQAAAEGGGGAGQMLLTLALQHALAFLGLDFSKNGKE